MNETDTLFYHRLVESFKWAYGARTRLGDPTDEEYRDSIKMVVKEMTSKDWAYDKFTKIYDTKTVNDPDYYGASFYNTDDFGTAHLSVVDQGGNAVSVTSTINLKFGAEIMSPSTGIIYNNQMDDFSFPNITNEFDVPPSPTNFIKPGKRPMSSMTPSILIDEDGDVRMVVGGSGGTKITTATALVTILYNYFGMDISQSVDAFRLHHQLRPMMIEHETSFDVGIIQGLRDIGHDTEDVGSAGSVVGAIVRNKDGILHAKADHRKSGGVAGF